MQIRVHAKILLLIVKLRSLVLLKLMEMLTFDDDHCQLSGIYSSLVTLDGVGIAKNLHVGGTIHGDVTGDLTDC